MKCDNATTCVTRLEEARICVKMDISKPLCHHLWLGLSGPESSHYQEIVYESILAFCGWCQKQDHLELKCGFKEKPMEKGREKVVQEDVGKGILKQA